MYTATITEKNLSGGNLQVVVNFSNGTDTFTEAYNVTSDTELDNKIKATIARLEGLETLASNVEPGVYTPLPPQPPAAPSAEELARNAWLEQWRVYQGADRAMKALAEAGFAPTEEETTRFTQLKTWVANNRKPEYSQYI